MSKIPKIAVIGGGLAGIAACFALVNPGRPLQIELLESRERFGGKVSSWQDAAGDWIESGLHVFFGSYQHIFQLMRQVGIANRIQWTNPEIQYRMPGGRGFAIASCESLPSPFNLLPNLGQITHFSCPDLWRYCQAIVPILRHDHSYIAAQDDLSFAEWIQRQNLSLQIMQEMFLPMTLSLKFLPVEQISAQVVLSVFELFITDPKGFKIGFLDGSPSLRLLQPFLDFLRKAGVHLRANCKINSLQRSATSLNLQTIGNTKQEQFQADYYIFALPCHKNAELLTPAYPDLPYFQNLRNFRGVPVLNAQLWFDRPLGLKPKLHFGTAGHTPVFADMNLNCAGYRTGDGGSLLETVVAPVVADPPLNTRSDAEVLALVEKELRSYFPNTSAQAKLRKASLVRIPQSVYAPHPGLEKRRPAQQTPVPNLFVAGGFTKGHRFLDSMEGAVQSGKLAAEKLLQCLL